MNSLEETLIDKIINSMWMKTFSKSSSICLSKTQIRNILEKYIDDKKYKTIHKTSKEGRGYDICGKCKEEIPLGGNYCPECGCLIFYIPTNE